MSPEFLPGGAGQQYGKGRHPGVFSGAGKEPPEIRVRHHRRSIEGRLRAVRLEAADKTANEDVLFQPLHYCGTILLAGADGVPYVPDCLCLVAAAKRLFEFL